MTYFVRIDKPDTLRRDILESARESILYQYDYEEYEELRQEKQELITQIDETYDELVDEADRLLDKLDLEELHQDIEVAMPDESDDGETTESLTETDRLKYTLRRIENTLDDL